MKLDARVNLQNIRESFYNLNSISIQVEDGKSYESRIAILSNLLLCYPNIRRSYDKLKHFPYPFTALLGPEAARQENLLFYILKKNGDIAVIMEYHGKIEEDFQRIRYFPYGDYRLYIPFLNQRANDFFGFLTQSEFRSVIPTNLLTEKRDLSELYGSLWALKTSREPKKDNPQIMTLMAKENKGRNKRLQKLPPGFKYIDLTEKDTDAILSLMKFYPLNSFRPESLPRNFHCGITYGHKLVSAGGILRYAKPIYILGDLVTNPEFARLGLATALCQRIIDKKTAKGMIVIADATDESVGVFQKLDFNEVEQRSWCVHSRNLLPI